jgi:tRNA pseudouridine38-40 synthase
MYFFIKLFGGYATPRKHAVFSRLALNSKEDFMKHYFITISYDGSAHSGWQRLKDNTDTIQGILENAFSKLFCENIKITGSGRTDAGVHALCQCADFYMQGSLVSNQYGTAENAISAVNELLPGSIRVTSFMELKNPVRPPFHSRKSCIKKTYAYLVSLETKPCVFTRKYVYNPCDTPLRLPTGSVFEPDFENMKKSADILLGTHDFRAFTSDKSADKSFVRTIESIKFHVKEILGSRVLVMEFTGNGFLYNMVRILAGTLLFAGLGKLTPRNIENALTSGNRQLAGPTLPPEGLFLVKPYYREAEVTTPLTSAPFSFFTSE